MVDKTPGMVQVDPATLTDVAKQLDAAAGNIPDLIRRANALNVGADVAGLNPIVGWLSDTAKDLRHRADLLANPDTSNPLAALSVFGLPTALAGMPGAGAKLEPGLQAILDANKNASPADRAKAVQNYFATLSPDQQAALAAADPLVVGNLDGVPLDVRYAANRINIQNELAKEQAYFKTLNPNDPTYKRTKDRVDTLTGFLNPREQPFQDPKTGGQGYLEVPRQFLVFDGGYGSTADPQQTPFADGRVAEVVGNLQTAQNVAFRVPGITNRLDNFGGFSTGGYRLTQQWNDQSKCITERPDTAVVNWLGYDTPEFGDSVDPSKAVTGGQQLADFRAGIAVDMNPNATVNLFAHSYGTLVSSKALQDGAAFNNVVFMGSPGLGPNINSVADLHMPNTHFYDMRAPGDWVSYSQGHGSDPAAFPDITRLATYGATGHSQYYSSGTESLANLQRILWGGDGHPLSFTNTTLDQEQPGAQEARDLVDWMHAHVPPDVVSKMGDDLDPVLQDMMTGRSSWQDTTVSLMGVFNKYNLFDYVPPGQLRNELATLGGQYAQKQSQQWMEQHGVPGWIAGPASGLAGLGSSVILGGLLEIPTVLLQLDALGNNLWQLVTGVGKDALNAAGDVVDAGVTVTEDSLNIGGDGVDIAVTGGKDGFKVVSDLADLTADPLNALDDLSDAAGSAGDFVTTTGSDLVDMGGNVVDSVSTVASDAWDAAGNTIDAAGTILDKGTNIVGNVIDDLDPFD